jgi:hypothetical protein
MALMYTATRSVKHAIKAIDKLSPYPLFYPFEMSDNEKSIFDEAIKESKNYLEFGIGGSTVRALQKSNTNIYAVESSSDWIDYMRKYIVIQYYLDKRLFISSVDIGPTESWGYPKSNESRNLFPAYSADIFNSIDSKSLDLALVDGRFRTACALKIILECHQNSNIRILFHDFWNREQYHIALKYLDTVDRADTIGLFSIKRGVDLDAVQKDYEVYKYEPN